MSKPLNLSNGTSQSATPWIDAFFETANPLTSTSQEVETVLEVDEAEGTEAGK